MPSTTGASGQGSYTMRGLKVGFRTYYCGAIILVSYFILKSLSPAWLSNRADTRKCRLFLCLETARNLVVQFLGAANPSEYSQRARAGEANQTRGDHDGPPLELGHMIALQIEEQLRTARNVGCLNPPRPNVWRTPEKQFKPSTARDGANDVKRFCSRRDLLGQRSVRRRVRYILAAGKESQERPALSRDVLANRPMQHRILSLQCIEDRSSCHFAVNLKCHISADACKGPQMCRHYNPNHGNVWTSTESTAGRSRTIGAQVSPASADA